jgi:HEPN domain-containing protein
MSDESHTWLRYAEENLRSARLLLEHGLLNPCLQNAQHLGTRKPPRRQWFAQ